MSYIKKNKITFCLLSQILLIPLASFFVHMFLHCNDIRISDSDHYVAFLVNEKYWFDYTNLTASVLHFYLPLYFFCRNKFLILCLPFLYQVFFVVIGQLIFKNQ